MGCVNGWGGRSVPLFLRDMLIKVGQGVVQKEGDHFGGPD